jgi:hypothetical protein
MKFILHWAACFGLALGALGALGALAYGVLAAFVFLGAIGGLLAVACLLSLWLVVRAYRRRPELRG